MVASSSQARVAGGRLEGVQDLQACPQWPSAPWTQSPASAAHLVGFSPCDSNYPPDALGNSFFTHDHKRSCVTRVLQVSAWQKAKFTVLPAPGSPQLGAGALGGGGSRGSFPRKQGKRPFILRQGTALKAVREGLAGADTAQGTTFLSLSFLTH